MKTEHSKIVRNCCKCGRVIYEQTGEEISFTKGVRVTSNGIKFKVGCKCGTENRFSIK